MVYMTSGDSEGDPEEFSEPPELFCDDCQDACSIEELEECPSSGDEVKHGVIAYESYCTSCCEEHFKSGGCRIEVGNCDMATELMAKQIKEFAEANGYSIFRENPRVFIDKNNAFCIGDNDVSLETIFEDKITLISDGKFDLFECKESILVKANGKKYNFSKETLKEIFGVFKELGCDEDGYGFLPAKGFLVVLSDSMFGIFTPTVDEIEFFDEKSGFMREMKHGYSFFDLSKKDGLVLVDAEMMDFNWPKLGDFDFVKLCRDIFALLPNIEEAKITDGTGDLGQDISAVEILNSLTGTEKKK